MPEGRDASENITFLKSTGHLKKKHNSYTQASERPGSLSAQTYGNDCRKITKALKFRENHTNDTAFTIWTYSVICLVWR